MNRYSDESPFHGDELPSCPPLGNVRSGAENRHRTGGVGCPLLTHSGRKGWRRAREIANLI